MENEFPGALVDKRNTSELQASNKSGIYVIRSWTTPILVVLKLLMTIYEEIEHLSYLEHAHF